MIFKVRWGDIQEMFKKRVMISNPGEETPIKFYFEDTSLLIPVIKTRGTLLCSILPLEQIRDLEEFKLVYLTDAFELMDNPLPKKLNALVAQY